MRPISLTPLLLLLLLLSSVTCSSSSSNNKEEETNHLSVDDIAILQFLADRTIDNADGPLGYANWTKYPAQLDNKSYRYPLAFLGYSMGVYALKTPAYTEVYIRILENVIERLLQKSIWQYTFDSIWKNAAWFPDPVVHENIMYSAHLAQVIALYESLSGDFKYTEKGWDFVWSETEKIHYDTRRLLDVILVQQQQHKDGGVACEPNWVYIMCNNHAQLAEKLFDCIHGSSYFNTSFPKWSNFLKNNAIVPQIERKTQYLKTVYSHDAGLWVPLTSLGGDAWSLTWMGPWWNADDLSFVCDGYTTMVDAPHKWIQMPKGGERLHPNWVAQYEEFGDDLSSSFFPALEKQCGGNAKSAAVFAYFNGIQIVEQGTDGKMRKTFNVSSEYREWITANMAISSMLSSAAELRSLYEGTPLYLQRKGNINLVSVDVNDVWVTRADSSATYIEFSLMAASNTVNVVATTVKVSLPNNNNDNDIVDTVVLRNGEKWMNVRRCDDDKNNRMLCIESPIPASSMVSFVIQTK